MTKVFALRAVAYYKKSALFLEGGPDPAASSSRSSVLVGILKETGVQDTPETAAAKHAAEVADHAPEQAADSDSADAEEALSRDEVVAAVAVDPKRASPPEATLEEAAPTSDPEPEDESDPAEVERD